MGKPWFSMVFPWFSHGFPMVLFVLVREERRSVETLRRRTGDVVRRSQRTQGAGEGELLAPGEVNKVGHQKQRPFTGVLYVLFFGMV